MKYLQIDLPQNVSVEFQLAQVGERILAYIIDMVAIGIVASIFASIGAFAFQDETILILIAIPIMSYTLTCEYLSNGMTLGKKLMGLRVVRLDNNRLTFPDTFTRWIFRLLEIHICSGIVAAILVSGSPFAQRIGGVLSNTYVIKTSPSKAVNLSQIRRISTQANHQVKYPEVLKIRESDMVLIKKVLERHAKASNAASMQAVWDLSHKAASSIGVNAEEIGKPHAFLRDILKDYIVLTR